MTRCDITVAPVAAYFFHFGTKLQDVFHSNSARASHQTAAFCWGMALLLLLFIADMRFTLGILAQISSFVKDISKKSFSVVARQLNVEYLAVKRAA